MSVASFKPISGRCECGAVSFRVNAAAEEVYHCHCSRCRRLHGSLFATYAYIKRSQITIEGADNTSIYNSPPCEVAFLQDLWVPPVC